MNQDPEETKTMWASLFQCLKDSGVKHKSVKMNAVIKSISKMEPSELPEEPIKPEPVPHNPMTDIEEIFYMANKPSTFKDFKLWYESRFKPEPLSLEEAAEAYLNNKGLQNWSTISKTDVIRFMVDFAGAGHSSREDRWISVDEKPPSDYERVLYHDLRDNHLSVGYFVPSQSAIPEYIKYYQILPKPPKEIIQTLK